VGFINKNKKEKEKGKRKKERKGKDRATLPGCIPPLSAN
jgi:hypothetical protein